MLYNITDKSFSLMEADGEDYYAIRINEGDYAGVIYKFGEVKVTENEGNANIEFEFDPLVTNEKYKIEELYDNPELETIAGRILHYMLEVGFYS